MMKNQDINRFRALLSYTSFDTHNGEHDRWISVEFPDEGVITVRNHNEPRFSDVRTETFRLADVVDSHDKLVGARYYEDFFRAWKKAEKADLQARAERERLMVAAKKMLLKTGTSQPTTAFKKMRIIKHH